MNNAIQPMKLILTIVERGQGSLMRSFYLDPAYQIRCLYQTAGRGTASSELLNILGIGTPERDVLLALATQPSQAHLFRSLKEGLGANTHARGIVCSLPLSAVNGLMAAALDRLETLELENGGTAMETDSRHSLIMVLVNPGYTDEVMATAKAAGARGGTVLRARWTGDEAVHEIMGITVQAEREILFIVSPHRDRNAIMEAINQKHGLREHPQAVVCALPVEQVARLG